MAGDRGSISTAQRPGEGGDGALGLHVAEGRLTRGRKSESASSAGRPAMVKRRSAWCSRVTR